MKQEEANIHESPSDGIITQIIHRYLPFWPVLAIVVSLSLITSFLYLRSQTKIYVASAKLLLKDPQKGTGDTKVLDALNIFSEKKTVENEIIVIRSSSLMEEVVKQLDLYATVYNQGKFQVEELYADNSPLYFLADDKNAITAGGKYKFKIRWKENLVEINNQLIPFNGKLTIAGSTYTMLVNNNYNRNVINKNYFVIFNSVQSTSRSIIGSIKAAPLSYASTVIDIKLETPIPEKGVAILNKLFEVYNNAGVADKNQMAIKTLGFIEDRIDKLTGQLDSVEKNIKDFKSTNEIIEIGRAHV